MFQVSKADCQDGVAWLPRQSTACKPLTNTSGRRQIERCFPWLAWFLHWLSVLLDRPPVATLRQSEHSPTLWAIRRIAKVPIATLSESFCLLTGRGVALAAWPTRKERTNETALESPRVQAPTVYPPRMASHEEVEIRPLAVVFLVAEESRTRVENPQGVVDLMGLPFFSVPLVHVGGVNG